MAAASFLEHKKEIDNASLIRAVLLGGSNLFLAWSFHATLGMVCTAVFFIVLLMAVMERRSYGENRRATWLLVVLGLLLLVGLILQIFTLGILQEETTSTTLETQMTGVARQVVREAGWVTGAHVILTDPTGFYPASRLLMAYGDAYLFTILLDCFGWNAFLAAALPMVLLFASGIPGCWRNRRMHKLRLTALLLLAVQYLLYILQNVGLGLVYMDAPPLLGGDLIDRMVHLWLWLHVCFDCRRNIVSKSFLKTHEKNEVA